MKYSFLRAALGVLFILAGCVLILGAALFTLNLGLNGYLAAHPAYLSAPPQSDPTSLVLDIDPPLAVSHAHSAEKIAAAMLGRADGFLDGVNPFPKLSTATPEPPALSLVATDSAPQATPTSPLDEPVEHGISSILPSPTPTPEPVAVEQAPAETPVALPEPAVVDQTPVEAPPPEPAVFSPPDPIVRLSIPRLKIKRAVIDIGLTPGKNGIDQWDTDRLFATQSRPDLVGHLEGSPYPGEGGNTVLVGHNYDLTGAGVFVNLSKLEVGDVITLITESGQEYTYQVFKVKTLTYSGGDESDLERHARFLGLTPDERLTLVTCSGGYIGYYNRRVYVVAAPVQP